MITIVACCELVFVQDFFKCPLKVGCWVDLRVRARKSWEISLGQKKKVLATKIWRRLFWFSTIFVNVFFCCGQIQTISPTQLILATSRNLPAESEEARPRLETAGARRLLVDNSAPTSTTHVLWVRLFPCKLTKLWQFEYSQDKHIIAGSHSVVDDTALSYFNMRYLNSTIFMKTSDLK